MSKTYKLVKPFYTYHPEIVVKGKKRKAFYGVEWTVWVKNNPKKPIQLHYMMKVGSEEVAKSAVAELESFGGTYGPWHVFYQYEWYIAKKHCVGELNTTKYSSVFCSKNHSE